MEQQENNIFNDRGFRKFIWLGIAVIMFQITMGLLIYYSIDKWEARGQFGDMFGVVNAVFSGLAFTGFLVALWMQNKELTLQRNELKLTREEMENSRKVQTNAAFQANKQAKLMLYSAGIQAKSTILQILIQRDERYRSVKNETRELHDKIRSNTSSIDRIARDIEKLERAAYALDELTAEI